MDKIAEKDYLATHAVVNYLHAGYQGRFAQLNILAQTGHPSFEQAHTSECRLTLDRISYWVQELWKGNPIFAASWNSAETFEAQNALRLLDQLKLDITAVVKELIRVFSEEKGLEKGENILVLCATFGRFAYSKEHYIRGFIEYAERFKVPDELARYSSLLPAAAEDVRFTHLMLATLRDEDTQKKEQLVRATVERTFPLIATFRTHLHDINQLLATYRGGFSFENGDFSPGEAKAWVEAKFNPVQAGYWRANGFSPSDSGGWVEAQVTAPTVAGIWKMYGFDFTNAPAWIKQNVPPPVARLWTNAEFGPSEARAYLERGIYDPAKARDEKSREVE